MFGQRHSRSRPSAATIRSIDRVRVALRDEGGATAVEYALLAGIIGVGTLVALEGIRNWVNEVGTNVGDELNSASTP